MSNAALVITVLSFISALALIWSGWLIYRYRGRRQAVYTRLRSVLDLPEPQGNPVAKYRVRYNDSEAAKELAAKLSQADLSLTPFDYNALRFGTGLLLTLLFQRAFELPWYWSLTASSALVPLGFQLLLRLRSGNLGQAVNRQLPEAVRMLSNSQHAGLSVAQGLTRVAHELPAPLGPLLRQVVREIQLGTPLTEALDGLSQRVVSRELQLVVTTILLQYEVGGDLAGALEQIAATLVERAAVEGEIQTATSEQRYVAFVLPVVPIAGIFLLNLSNPGYAQVLVKPLGLVLLGVSVALQVIGFVLIHRTARIKV